MPLLLRLPALCAARRPDAACCSTSAAPPSSACCCSATCTSASPARPTRWSASGSSASPPWRSSPRRCSAACTGGAARARVRSAGLIAGFALWVYTLMLPSIAKSGWWPTGFVAHGPFGIELLRPEQLFGLTGLDNLTHSLFWSLLVNVGLYAVCRCCARPRRARRARRCCSSMSSTAPRRRRPVFWRGRARVDDLLALAGRFLGAAARGRLFEDHARRRGAADVTASYPMPGWCSSSKRSSPAPSAARRRA